MALNKLRKLARKHPAPAPGLPESHEPVDRRPGPAQVVAGRELLHEFRGRLSEEERRLADLRSAGRSWAAIAGEVGGTEDAVRKRYARALARVSGELGLDE
jgi:hypothetical protein